MSKPYPATLKYRSDSVFSTQKILLHARLAEQGRMIADPINEALGLELDMINILYVHQPTFSSYPSDVSFSIRLVQILSMQNNRK